MEQTGYSVAWPCLLFSKVEATVSVHLLFGMAESVCDIRFDCLVVVHLSACPLLESRYRMSRSRSRMSQALAVVMFVVLTDEI